MSKVLILVNHDVVIYNFRKELVEQLISNKYEVYISSPYGKKIELLKEIGAHYVETNIERHGTNVVNDFKLIAEYRRMIKKIKPDIVISYTIKPNIYGGLACRSLKVPYIATITGLGTALEKDGIMRNIIINLYKIAFKNVQTLFFQNNENMNFFKKHNIALDSHKLVPGSGVNLEEFPFNKYPKESQEINILYIGRVMKEKGIEELAEAAKLIKKINEKVNFEAVGFYEEDYMDKAEELERLNIITFHGVQENVKEFIINCNAVILPSYHEGMANVLLEAGAIGRPIIASSISGCKEIFDEGISGLGLEPKNVDSLYNTLNKFINLTYSQKKAMGFSARKKIESQFDRRKVVDSYLVEIENVIKKGEHNEFI
ncbi:glycosyltransferase family 4 protein [Alkalicoccus daliensis]|uniref:Galacturonosyltransferase n=1 Tax=Alkalicoccus daliensis TaxID=745820 RepID=A0A1H0GGF2_9BACI|nr:glycosyltransferase family 4 protein [Alkalicoccus daliensis]SDO05952.1 galacturonosyltransferase [Alkalicoccus daliensis]